MSTTGFVLPVCKPSSNTVTVRMAYSAEVCRGSEKPSLWRAARHCAAVLVLSATLMDPIHVLAQDSVLVFDHDQSLAGADFSKRTDLKGAIFSKSNCRNASFSGADLTNAQLDDGNVRGILRHHQCFSLSIIILLIFVSLTIRICPLLRLHCSFKERISRAQRR